MAKGTTDTPTSATQLIDGRISELADWRGPMLARLRALIHAADPAVVEEWKWRGVPVWSHDGIICTGETYKAVVKLTFAKGAALPDPASLFNASLEGNTRRAIDVHEGEAINAKAFTALIKAAVALNTAKSVKPAKAVKAVKAKPKLLSGGNPQIAKATGDAPVQDYIAALPDWKRAVAAHVDALVSKTIPNVQKAVKWNSPMYGMAGQGWFLSMHAFKSYLKLAFFDGVALKPMPPGSSKTDKTRYLDIHEADQIDDAQLKKWLKQAAALPGWGKV